MLDRPSQGYWNKLPYQRQGNIVHSSLELRARMAEVKELADVVCFLSSLLSGSKERCAD